VSDAHRIGVLGGTFDPIHNTHLAIARAAMQQARLDTVLFVVSANPPHKRGATFATAEDRLALVEAAVAEEQGMEACRIELDRDGPSYMADTLQLLRDQNPGAELYLIIGMDSLIDLPKWHAPERILKLAHLLVVPRPGEIEVPSMVMGRYTRLNFTETDVSSTDIRNRIAECDPCTDVLPAAVFQKIRERGLYCECTEYPPRG